MCECVYGTARFAPVSTGSADEQSRNFKYGDQNVSSAYTAYGLARLRKAAEESERGLEYLCLAERP